MLDNYQKYKRMWSNYENQIKEHFRNQDEILGNRDKKSKELAEIDIKTSI